MSRIREYLSSEAVRFAAITVCACLLVGILSYFAGRNWVGKYLAQQQAEREKLELQTPVLEAKASPTSLGPMVVIREREPTEAERRELGIEQEQVSQESSAPQRLGEGEQAAEEADEQAGKPSEESATESPPAEPARAEKVPPSPPPREASPTASGWITTAGSYRDSRNAQQVVTNLAAQGVQAGVQVVNVRGQTYHRVLLGPYTTKAEAEAAAETVRAAGYPSQVMREP
jgi:cell division protein FtsN